MKKFLATMERIQAIIGFLNFGILTIVVSLQVLSRFIIQKPLLWSEEVARFLLFWLVMNGAALAVIKARHFSTELFAVEDVKNSGLKFVLTLLPGFCTLLVGVIMVIYGIEYTVVGSYRIMPISQINMMYVYVAIPLSGIMIAVYSLLQVISAISAGLK